MRAWTHTCSNIHKIVLMSLIFAFCVVFLSIFVNLSLYLTHTHTHPLSLSLSHTHTHTHTNTHTHTHSHTGVLFWGLWKVLWITTLAVGVNGFVSVWNKQKPFNIDKRNSSLTVHVIKSHQQSSPHWALLVQNKFSTSFNKPTLWQHTEFHPNWYLNLQENGHRSFWFHIQM